jgi:hypothetical protein
MQRVKSALHLLICICQLLNPQTCVAGTFSEIGSTLPYTSTIV